MNETCQVLHDTLKCEICKSPLKAGKARWYRCQNHHQTCQNCKETGKIDKCSCGKWISKEHCPITEKLLKVKIMRFNCTNESRGCNEILSEKDMFFHENECLYRNVECLKATCNTKLPFHKLLGHMTKNNCFDSNSSSTNGKFVINYNDLSEEMYTNGGFIEAPEKMVFDNRVFFLGGDQSRDVPTYYLWVQLYGSKYEAKNYYYTLELHGIDPNIKNIFTGQVFAIDENRNAIKETKECFGIQFDIFKKLFVDKNRKYKISITIRKMKVEAMDENCESGVSDNDE